MFWKKTKPKNSEGIMAAVFDFGSTSVKLLLCRYIGDIVEVLDGRKLHYPPQAYGEYAPRMVPELSAALKQAFVSLTAGQTVPIGSAVVGIAGSAIEGYTSQINYRRARPERQMQSEEVEEILANVETHADRLMRRMIVWETEDDATILLNSEILSISLDDKTVDSPVGLAGEALSVVVYHSYARAPVVKGIMRLVRGLGLEVRTAGATMYAMLRLLVERRGPEFSGIVLDIGGRATEIGLIQQGRLLGHRGLDVAGSAFTTSIAQDYGIDQDDAELLKLGFAAGTLQEETMADIRGIVGYDCKIFLSGVELVVKDFPGGDKTPEQAVMVGGGSLLPGMSASLSSAKLSAGQQLAVMDYRPEHLPRWRDQSGRLTSPADIPILSVAVDAIDFIADVEN